MPALSLAKSTLILVALLANLSPGVSSSAAQSPEPLLTCEQAMNDLARFDKHSTEWGATNEGDPYSSARMSSDEGEALWLGTTVFKSKSRFKKSARVLIDDQELVQSAPLLDAKGREIGQRVVKETRAKGKVTNVRIFRITDRMIQGVSAPTLKLALTVERTYITCRVRTARDSGRIKSQLGM